MLTRLIVLTAALVAILAFALACTTEDEAIDSGSPTPTEEVTETPNQSLDDTETPGPTEQATATPDPTARPTPDPTPAPTQQATPAPTPQPTLAPPAAPTPVPMQQGNCDPSYPMVCIAPFPPDLNCGDIPYTNFKVVPPDPHGFDGNNDGIACVS